MKQFFLFFIALINPGFIFAQELVVSINIESSRLQNIEGFQDQDHFVVKGEPTSGSYVVYVINAQTGVTQSFSGMSTETRILGIASNTDSINIYLMSSYPILDDKIECLTFSKSNRKFTGINEVTRNNTKNLIGLNIDGQFSTLSLQKKESKLVLNTYAQGSIVNTKHFSIEDEELFQHLKKNAFTHVPNSQEVSFEQASSQNKVYQFHDKLVLVIDDWLSKEQAEVLIVELNLNESRIVSRRISLPYVADVDHNSFLWNNQLYVLGIDKSLLNVSVFDIISLQKIQAYHYLKGEPITIKKSDLIKNGENLDEQWKGHWRESDITKYTLKELNGGIPVISVSSADNQQFRLLIGNHIVPKSGYRGGMMVTTGGGTINTPGGPVSSPVSHYWTPANYGGGLASEISFYGYLRKESLSVSSHIPSNHGAFYRIEKQMRELKDIIKIGGQGVINAEDGTYLLYINKQSKALVIEKF